MKEWMKFYDVSPDGEVKSLDREYVNSRGQTRKVKPHILKTNRDRYGYEKVTLCCHGRNRNTTVGRLVAEKYLPNPKNLPQVNHKNENPLDNRVENLEWCTAKHNSSYGTRTERSALARSKPLIASDYEHDEEHFNCASKAAEILSLKQGNISACLRGDQRQSGGYTFRYADEEGVNLSGD